MSDTVEALKSTVDKLEKRIQDLESRLTGSAPSSGSSDGMRMILIGPPGAGMSKNVLLLKHDAPMTEVNS